MGIMMWERAGQLWSNDKDKRGGVEKAAAALFAACHRFRLLKEAHQLCVKAAEEEESLAVEQLVLALPPAPPGHALLSRLAVGALALARSHPAQAEQPPSLR